MKESLSAKRPVTMHWQHDVLLLAKPFKISRGSKTHANVIVLTLTINDYTGKAEAVPYARYNESIESTIAQLESLESKLAGITALPTADIIEQISIIIEQGLTKGSAKNLLDCALWDVKAKYNKCSVYDLLNVPVPKGIISAQTLSVDTIETMQQHANQMAHFPLLKVKLDATDVLEKMRAIFTACPNSQFIVDANEAWSFELLDSVVDELAQLNVKLIEQPLPCEQDGQLIGYTSAVPLCADESCHGSDDIENLQSKYQVINIKLDKTGGLTEAVALFNTAKKYEMGIMLGCMVASSLAMAPIFSLAAAADFVDLDGPMLLAKDRDNGFTFSNGEMLVPTPFLWGNL